MIKVATDFSPFPGSRYMSEGKHSGEEFRNNLLAPAFKKALEENKKVIVNLDGTAGYGTSFLEEIFGGLIRENNFDYTEVINRLEIISNEEDYLREDALEFIQDANEARNTDEATI
ncbi:hypothetical protein GCM10011532_18970 [Christiangramia forsetii]|nr:hypothetical protein GCM10011532_18970 [Christiangramia forsetii]